MEAFLAFLAIMTGVAICCCCCYRMGRIHERNRPDATFIEVCREVWDHVRK